MNFLLFVLNLISELPGLEDWQQVSDLNREFKSMLRSVQSSTVLFDAKLTLL
jgi:hypothetical protein